MRVLIKRAAVITGAAAVVLASAVGMATAGSAPGAAAGRHLGNALTSASQEVLAYGHQVTGNGLDPNHDTFAIFAHGTGLSATGSFSVWLYSTCASGPCEFRWNTAKVTCVTDVNSNHVWVTGTATYLGVKETLVADAVDNSNPSNGTNPDGIRFTTYADGGAGGCESPSPQGPVNILRGDIQIQNPQ